MTLADGLLVIVLTLKASVKELCILAIYLILGMFIFSTLVFYSEVYSAPNVGIPDSLIGRFNSTVQTLFLIYYYRHCCIRLCF